jgi:hypothetical protein
MKKYLLAFLMVSCVASCFAGNTYYCCQRYSGDWKDGLCQQRCVGPYVTGNTISGPYNNGYSACVNDSVC